MLTAEEFLKGKEWKFNPNYRERFKPYYRAWTVFNLAHSFYVQYPDLKHRPFKAAIYVLENTVWVNELLEGSHDDGVFAQVRTSAEDSIGHLIALRDGVFVCDCKDYEFNLKAMEVTGSDIMQQPCAHIIAVALVEDSVLDIFLPDEYQE